MEWESWCRAYPAREVEKIEHDIYSYEGPFESRVEAESHKDWMEVTYECGGFEVVSCKDQFWILG